MNTVVVLMRAQVSAAYNNMRVDVRVKVALCVMVLLDVGLGIWSIQYLQMNVQRWLVQGIVARQLLLYGLFSWIGIATLSTIGCLQRMLSSDEALVLFMLPLTPASRFRAFYSAALLDDLWNWMLLEAIISSRVLFPLLGWQALSWVALLEIGALFTVLCTILVVLLAVRYIFSGKRWSAWLWLWLIMIGIGVEICFLLFPSVCYGILIAVSSLSSNVYLVAMSATLLVALGPCAALPGSLYVQAFLVTQAWDRSHVAWMLPGIRGVTSILARQRTLIGAFMTRMVLNQSRNPLAWLRLAMLVVALALFSWLHQLALRAGWSHDIFLAVYAAALGLLPVLEQAPCAISGESNRMTLYLTMPLEQAQLLRAKLFQFLFPALCVGVVVNLSFAWQLHIAVSEALVAIAATSLLITGVLTVMVWGSVWDEDVNLVVEGTLQTIMQEEGPTTPRRMALFSLGLVVFAGMVFVLWKVPAGTSCVMLLVSDFLIVPTAWQLACRRIRTYVL